MSGNSQHVEDPLDLAVLFAATMVVTQQELVGEDRRQQMGAVVVQPTVPHTMFPAQTTISTSR